MARQYVCENSGATYDCMLIDWPDCCSMECDRDKRYQAIARTGPPIGSEAATAQSGTRPRICASVRMARGAFGTGPGDGISLERGPSSSAVNDGELLTHQLAEWCGARRLLLERLPIMVPQRKSAARAARSIGAVRVRREGREAVERWTAVHSRYIFASLWP